jgi:hypothetical protein
MREICDPSNDKVCADQNFMKSAKRPTVLSAGDPVGLGTLALVRRSTDCVENVQPRASEVPDWKRWSPGPRLRPSAGAAACPRRPLKLRA